MIHKAFNEDDFRQDKKKTKTHNIAKILDYYLALASLVVLFMGVYLWGSIVGFEGPDIAELYKLNHFDAVLRVAFAILMPTLGVGLWLHMRWAIILWGLMTLSLSAFYFLMEKPGFIAKLSLYSVGSLFILYSLSVLSFYAYRLHKAKKKN